MINSHSHRMNTDSTPLKIKLMPHQKAMVYRMLNIEKKLYAKPNAFAMMSDKPGAGKSYAILAFLFYTNKIIFKASKQHVNLIVVPYNICTQWHAYFHKIYGPPGVILNYTLLTEYKDVMGLYVNPSYLLQNDVVLTTSLYFDTIAKTCASLHLKIQRVFFDEADTIKNLLMTPLASNMTWFVSASISTLFGSSKDIRIGQYSLNLATLKQNDVCCDPEFINANIVLDPPIMKQYKCDNIYFQLLVKCFPEHSVRLEAMDYSCLINEFGKNYPHILFDSERNACRYVKTATIDSIKNSEREITELDKEYKYVTKQYNIVKDLDREKAEALQKRISQISRDIDKHKANIDRCKHRLNDFAEFEKQNHITFENERESEIHSKLDVISNYLLNIKRDATKQCIIFTDYDFVYKWLRAFMTKHHITFKDLDGGNIDAMDKTIGTFKNKQFQILLADSSMYIHVE